MLSVQCSLHLFTKRLALRFIIRFDPLLSRIHGTKVGDKWLCVVVKCLADDAFIITAYLTDKLKKGTLLWPTK